MGNNITSKDVHIFISHADCDRELAKALVSLLMKCYDIQAEQIFCTASVYTGISIGHSFIDEIVKNYNESQICFYLLSDQYLNRQNCLIELGWILQKPEVHHFLLDVRGEGVQSKFPSMLSHLQRYTIDLLYLVRIREELKKIGLVSQKGAEIWGAASDRLVSVAYEIQYPYYYVNYTEEEKTMALYMLLLAYLSLKYDSGCSEHVMKEKYNLSSEYISELFSQCFKLGFVQHGNLLSNPIVYKGTRTAKLLLKKFGFVNEYGYIDGEEFENRIADFTDTQIKSLVYCTLRY